MTPVEHAESYLRLVMVTPVLMTVGLALLVELFKTSAQ